MGGAWVAGDDYTWFASALFGAYWLLPLTVEVITQFKKRPIEPVNWTVSGFKLSFNLDFVVLFITLALTCIGKSACLVMDAGICWPVECDYSDASSVISCLYFDVYYFYLLGKLATDAKITTGKKRMIRLFIPVVWTCTGVCFLLQGASLYDRGMANIYSNGLWNMSSVLFPIICIDSAINSHGAMFVLANKKNGDMKIASANASSHSSQVSGKLEQDSKRTIEVRRVQTDKLSRQTSERQ
ncbi:hypothetical protein HK103_002006 [Boothiomyces macroporosus]|uniref:Uncharacterized protein n=1 Tax=Boothiomyces macroporosus TaxID=261099 RepID=A0AAD5U9S0_9FUNG|nr:hypothetical protein HK103_002006 [Boothiomyces macroporosus]